MQKGSEISPHDHAGGNDLRIFLGLTEIAGYYSNLRDGFRALGYTADFIPFSVHPYAYAKADGQGWLIRTIRALNEKLPELSQWYWPGNILYVIGYAVLSGLFFCWALFRYDVFILGARSHFLPGMIDLPLLRLCGKRIVCVFHGSDSRPPYLNGIHAQKSPRDLLRQTRRVKREVDRINRYANHIIDHPPTSHFHRRPVIKWLSMGIPFSAIELETSTRGPEKKTTVQIVHAPSRPREKGSDRILEAVAKLKAEGLPLQLTTLVDKPNQEVLAALANCDFVVDELYSDTTMAGLATEAAWFGKPSIVGGYEINELRQCTDKSELPPAHVTAPEEVATAIRTLAMDTPYRISLGASARDFVRNRWSPTNVARRYIKLVEEGPSQTWLWHPHQNKFIHGWGLPKNEGRNLLVGYLDHYGPEGLCLPDKPELAAILIAKAERARDAKKSG